MPPGVRCHTTRSRETPDPPGPETVWEMRCGYEAPIGVCGASTREGRPYERVEERIVAARLRVYERKGINSDEHCFRPREFSYRSPYRGI